MLKLVLILLVSLAVVTFIRAFDSIGTDSSGNLGAAPVLVE